MGKTVEMSEREGLSRSGVLGEVYGADAFFKVYPCYGIDCVKLSFVKTGSNGKGFDLYIDIDEFDNLCDDILSGSLKSRLGEEKATAENKYPYSFKWIGGKNGKKELKLSASRSKNAEVNVYGKCESEFMNVPTTYNKLRTLAKYFKRTSKERFDEHAKLIMETARKKEEKYHNKQKEEERDNIEKPGNKPDISHPKSVLTQRTQQTSAVPHQELKITLFLCSQIEKVEGKSSLYVARALDDNEKETQLYFNKESLLNLGKNKFDELVKSSKEEQKPVIHMLAATNKGTYLLKKLLA